MDYTKSDAFYSTMDAIITIIDRKMPEEAQSPEVLERLFDEILLHFKMKGS